MEHHINVFYLSASQMKTKAVGFQPWKKSSCCNNKKGRSSLPCQSLSYKSISTCSKLLQGHVHKNSITVDKKKKKRTLETFRTRKEILIAKIRDDGRWIVCGLKMWFIYSGHFTVEFMEHLWTLSCIAVSILQCLV